MTRPFCRRRPLLVAALLLSLAAAASPLPAQQTGKEAAAEAPSAEDRAQQREAVRWLADNAAPLTATAAGNGFADLAPFGAMVGDARLVFLGEATHGTREFFQLKHRFLEYLVEEKGFTAFAIEASAPESFDIDRYLQTGEGDPDRLLTGLHFWTWNTEEVLELVRWMRSYNADPSHDRKLRFYGFDIQFPQGAARRLLAELDRLAARLGPELDAEARRVLGLWRDPLLARNRDLRPEGADEELLELTERLEAALAPRTDDVGAQRGAQLERARYLVRVLRQSIELSRATDGRSMVRDRAMADNLLWALAQEGPAGKVVGWAHNLHVATHFERSELWRPMGMVLRQRLGDDLVTLGFALGQGSAQARQWGDPIAPLRAFELGPPRAGTTNAALAAAGHPLALWDLRRLPDGSGAAAWIAASRPFRSFGSAYSPGQPELAYPEHQLSRQFDLLVFVDRTTASRPLPGGLRPSDQVLARAVNLGFEEGRDGGPPPGWQLPDLQRDLGWTAVTSWDERAEGRASALLTTRPGRLYGEAEGRLSQLLDASPYRGDTVQLSAAIKAEPNDGGNAYLLLVAHPRSWSGDARPLSAVAVEGAGWQPVATSLEVPEGADRLELTLVLTGGGRAWFDAVELTVLGGESEEDGSAEEAGEGGSSEGL